jgi:hypothetical protein
MPRLVVRPWSPKAASELHSMGYRYGKPALQ